MSQPILIVGGGPAGLAAAHALARIGQPSILVDKAERLGGAPILSGYAKLVPSGEWAKDAIGGMVRRARQKRPTRCPYVALIYRNDISSPVCSW